MRFIDLFAGVGGMRLGLERANNPQGEHLPKWRGSRSSGVGQGDMPNGETGKTGWNGSSPDSEFRCVWSCEIDKWCRSIYRHKWGSIETGDIKAVYPSSIPDFDLLYAGFPCQSFSVAGKRKGFDDTRGTLFFDIAKIAEAKRPRLLLLENVKGLLSHDGGETFARILQTLDGLGYWVEWQVLDSQHFGVPQHRERVFIVGHLGEHGGREIFPVGETNEINHHQNQKFQMQCTNTLRTNYSSGFSNETYILQEHSFSGEGGKGRGIRMFDEGVTPALTQQMGTGGGNVPMVMPCLTPDRIEKRQHGRRFKEDGEPMFTLTGQDVHGIGICDILERKPDTLGRMMPLHRARGTEARIRRLTPIECERLQGFPDNFTKWGIDEKGNKIEISDTQRYKTMGNAVTTNVIEFLGRRLLEAGSASVGKEEG